MNSRHTNCKWLHCQGWSWRFWGSATVAKKSTSPNRVREAWENESVPQPQSKQLLSLSKIHYSWQSYFCFCNLFGFSLFGISFDFLVAWNKSIRSLDLDRCICTLKACEGRMCGLAPHCVEIPSQWKYLPFKGSACSGLWFSPARKLGSHASGRVPRGTLTCQNPLPRANDDTHMAYSPSHYFTGI